MSAWVSPKVYAILMNSEDGKDIAERLGEMSQEECDKELDEFFGNGGKGYSQNADYQNAKNESKFKESEDFSDKSPVVDKFKESLNKMLDNKHYSKTAKKLMSGKFDSNYSFTEKDYKFFDDMFNGKAVGDDIHSTDLYNYFEKKATEHEPLHPEDNQELIDKGVKEFKEIITKGKTSPEFKQKKITIITGLPSAGKSSEEIIPYLESGIELDNDIAKGVPALAGEDKYNNGFGAGVVHRVAKAIEKQVTKELIEEGYNVVIPMVGDGDEAIVKRVAPFIDAGYDVPTWIHKDVDNDTSRMRAFKRAVDTNRYIRDDFIKEYGEGPNETYKKALKNQGVVKANGREIKFRTN